MNMGKHEVIQVAALAKATGIEHEVALMGRVEGNDIECGGYSIWLRDCLRGEPPLRFDGAAAALEWLESRRAYPVGGGK